MARGVRTGLGVRRATSLDEQLADLSIEVAVHGKLPEPQPLSATLPHVGEYLLGDGKQGHDAAVLRLGAADGEVSAPVAKRVDVFHAELLEVGEG